MSFNLLQLYIFSLMLHLFVYFLEGVINLELFAPHVEDLISLQLPFDDLILPLFLIGVFIIILIGVLGSLL